MRHDYTLVPAAIAAQDLRAGWQQAIGPIRLGLQEIQDFARLVDPQPIHIDPAVAAQSRFGGIIASGLHVYIAYHTRFWVAMNAGHFQAGLSFDGARFYQPVFPDQDVYSLLHITAVERKPHKATQIVQWHWEFLNAQEEVIQEARFTTYHSLRDAY
jgi:acyl dehydratase